jgi:tRNA 2-selenouridine synthase SelU
MIDRPVHESLISKKQALKDGYKYAVYYSYKNDKYCYYVRTPGGASELKQTLIKLQAKDIEVKDIVIV